MTELISRELYDIIIMVCCGIGIMIIFETMKQVGRIFMSSKVEQFFYLMSWLLASGLFSECLYRCEYGQISIHCTLAVILGILLWKKIIYDIIFKGK